MQPALGRVVRSEFAGCPVWLSCLSSADLTNFPPDHPAALGSSSAEL